jgi:hypothetical protein
MEAGIGAGVTEAVLVIDGAAIDDGVGGIGDDDFGGGTEGEGGSEEAVGILEDGAGPTGVGGEGAEGIGGIGIEGCDVDELDAARGPFLMETPDQGSVFAADGAGGGGDDDYAGLAGDSGAELDGASVEVGYGEIGEEASDADGGWWDRGGGFARGFGGGNGAGGGFWAGPATIGAEFGNDFTGFATGDGAIGIAVEPEEQGGVVEFIAGDEAVLVLVQFIEALGKAWAAITASGSLAGGTRGILLGGERSEARGEEGEDSSKGEE